MAAIYNKPLKAAVILAILFIVVLAGLSYWRGSRYQSLAKSYSQQQIDVFKDVFPESKRIPGDVAHRLDSERRKLAGLGGQSLEGELLESVKNNTALDHLLAILNSLPTDMRYRILSLNIQPDVIRIDGQAQSHLDAERIFSPLERTGLYTVEAPKTQALKDKGVSFLFTARPAEEKGV